jgi:hypothetical protein
MYLRCPKCETAIEIDPPYVDGEDVYCHECEIQLSFTMCISHELRIKEVENEETTTD